MSKHPRPKRILLIPVLLAVGLLGGLSQFRPLAEIEHSIFFPYERFYPNSYYLDRGGRDSLDLRVYRIDLKADHQANIGSYRVDDETREIMGPNGGDPAEWAQFLRQTRLPDDRLIVINSSLSWTDTTELALRTLQSQIDLTPCLVVGLRAELLNTESALPPELAPSVIKQPVPGDWTLPEVDYLTIPPSVTAPLFGISEVRGLKIEKNGDSLRLPMLIRWGDHVLPSLQLASLLTMFRVSPDELVIDSEGYLRLGETGPIMKVDSSGFAWLDSRLTEVQSASQLQIYPTNAETTKLIDLGETPYPSKGLAAQLAQASGTDSQTARSYQRWPVFLEILMVVFSSFLLLSRKPWSFWPVTLALIALSLPIGRWIPLIPLIFPGLAYPLLCFLAPKPAISGS